MAKLNSSDSKRIKELIRKVRLMAERGEKGERETAKTKLKELMAKYKIKKFEEQKIKKYSFKLADFTDCKIIMTHCILDTHITAEIQGSASKKELYCKLTDEQYIDIVQKFNHYYAEFYRQKEAFTKAFILKNNLGVGGGEDGEEEDDKDNSTEIDEILNMYGTVKQTNYKKHELLN